MPSRATDRPTRPPFEWTSADVGLLVLRAFAGLSLALAHGFGKLPPSDGFVARVEGMGFPLPQLFAWAAGLSESLGGVLLALGLFTRPAALFVLTTMAVAVVLRHAGDPFGERELALMYAMVALHFLLTGPGRLSLDAYLRPRLLAALSRARGLFGARGILAWGVNGAEAPAPALHDAVPGGLRRGEP